MPSPFDPDVERELFAQAEAERQVLATADSELTDSVLDAFESLAKAYPWLDASTMDALASSEIDASDIAARSVAGAALAEGMQLGTFTGRPMTETESMRAALGPDGYRKHLEAQEKSANKSSRRFRRAQTGPIQDESNLNLDLVMGPVLRDPAPAANPLTLDLSGAQPINERPEDNKIEEPSFFGRVTDTWREGAGFYHDKAGDALGAVGLGGGDPIFEYGIKPTIRTAVSIMDMGPQYIQGSGTLIHDAWVQEGWREGLKMFGAVNNLPMNPEVAAELALMTDFGVAGVQAGIDIQEGRLPSPDLGQGYFPSPESEVGQFRLRNQMRYAPVAEIEGNPVPFSIGRFAAAQVTEPGSTEFAVVSGLGDLGLEIVGPGALAIDSVLIYGTRGRRTVDAVQADGWLSSDTGVKVTEALTDSTDFNFVDKALGGAANPQVVAKIVDADDPGEVANLLRSQLGIEVTRQPRLPRFQPQVDWVQDHLPSLRRMASYMPESSLSIIDARQRVDTARRILITAGADSAEVSQFAYRFARETDPTKLRDIAREMLESVAMRAAEAEGVTDVSAASNAVRFIATSWQRGIDDATAYWVSEFSKPGGGTAYEHMDFWHDITDGAAKPSPQAFAELLSSSIPMPTPRDLRNIFATPQFQAFMKVPGARISYGAAEILLSSAMSVWKAGRLLRIAWPVKILTEGQLRLAFSGYSSIFNHPMDYILHAMAESRSSARGATDIQGRFLSADEVTQRAMFSSSDVSRIGEAQRYAFLDGFEEIYKVGKSGLPVDTNVYATHWADQAYRLSTSPEFAMRLRTGDFAEASDVFWNNMPQIRSQLQRGRDDTVRDIVNNRLDADDFLRTNVDQRLAELTNGNNPVLLQVLREGSLNGQKMVDNSGALNKKFVAEVEQLFDILPDVVVGRRVTSMNGDVSKMDEFVNRGFDNLMTKPSNALDRSPLFRQQYWRSLERLARNVDPSSAGRLTTNLEKANLSKAQTERIAGNLNQLPPPGNSRILSADEADAIAKAEALNQVKKTLYDLSERNQFFDITRLIFPFGDAFFEVFSRWIAIMAENPNRMNKAEALVDYAGGWFQENQWGDEVFTYPVAGSLLSAVSGIDMELEGQVSALSMMTETFPGFGPVVQLPAAAAIPDDPAWDGVRDFISSGFGLPPDVFSDPVGAFADTAFPPWVRRLGEYTTGVGFTANENRIFENHAIEIAMHMVANDPQWSLDTLNSDERINALVNEARSRARSTAAIRSAVSFLLPGAPSYQYNTDITGEELRAWMVQEEYRRIQEEFGVAQAPGEFIDRYGHNAAALINPKSRDLTNGGGTPIHQAGVDWVRENRFAEEKYPQVYGFFAPPAVEEDDFVYSAYVSTFADDPERQALNVRQSVELLQDFTARHLYEQAKEAVLEEFDGEVTVEVQEYLRDVKDELELKFPGYVGIVGLAEPVNVQDQIGQLIDALDDERLADNPLIAPLNAYFEARQYAIDNAEGTEFKSGGGFDVQLRMYLYQVGTELTEKVPEFGEVWERVLYREFRSAHEDDLEGEN